MTQPKTKCKICHVQEADAGECADCGKPVCKDCSVAFPHHVPPHVRCGVCYEGKDQYEKNRKASRSEDWWKRGEPPPWDSDSEAIG